MRIIHTADWHIGKLLCDYSLLEDQRYFFESFYLDLAELKPDVIIVAGDIYDRSIPSSDAVELLSNVLNKIVLEMKIPTVIISGNHDSRERLSFATELLRNNNLYMEGSLQESIKKIEINNVNFYPLPYFEPYNARSIYSNKLIKSVDDATQALCEKTIATLDEAQINILIAHGFFMYSNNNASEKDIDVGGSYCANAKAFDAFDYVALGHIHSSREIGSSKMRYAGSPLKYSIDEANHIKSYTIIDIEDKNNISISTKEITPLRDVRNITDSFNNLVDPQNNSNSDDYVYVNLTDENYILGAINSLKAIFPNILGIAYPNIIYTSNIAMPDDFVANKDNVELFCGFFNQVNNCDINEEQKQLVRDIFNEI